MNKKKVLKIKSFDDLQKIKVIEEELNQEEEELCAFTCMITCLFTSIGTLPGG